MAFMETSTRRLVAEYLDSELDAQGARALADHLDSNKSDERGRREFAELARQARSLAAIHRDDSGRLVAAVLGELRARRASPGPRKGILFQQGGEAMAARRSGPTGARFVKALVSLAGAVVLAVCALGTQAWSQTHELPADDNDGHGQYWVKRYVTIDGTVYNSWGIVGDHVEHDDFIWFNSFEEASGTYRVWLGAILEADGCSYCRLYIDGTQVSQVHYPASTGGYTPPCSGPNKAQDLDFGEHQINNGDQIKLWGQSVYPCSPDHGQYTRWYKLKFVFTGGAVEPTVIAAPADGTVLMMGSQYTLAGTGEGTLTWSYDADSDGKGEQTIGTGSSVNFTIPTGITDPMKMTIFLDASGGDKVSKTYDVRDPGSGNNPPDVNLAASPDAGTAPVTVSFDAGSSDPDGDTLTHEWDWDYSGSFSVDQNTGTVETATHTYDAAGTYTAAVRVSDGQDSVTDTVTITVTGSGTGTVVIECEDMTLSDCKDEGEYIAVDYGAGKTTGTATASFPGEAGRYRVEVVIVKEDDGQPTLEVSIAGTVIGTINYPLGSASRDPETVDLGEFDIASGAEVKLVATMDADAAARVDKIIFTPTGGGDPNDTDADGLPDAWETTYFGNLDQGPNNDFDDDGASNYREYTHGTDPTDDTDFPPAPSTNGGATCSHSSGSGLALAVALLAFAAYTERRLRRARAS